ncbi:protein GVQW3 [Trichonephila clavipes]|nr:protein GVQW3 [Trichonephila clavipes]
MEKRAVIIFCTKLGKSASETYQLIKQVYGDCCLSISNVFVWHNRFLDGRDAVEDYQRSGRPISLSFRTPEIIEKVRDFVARDRCVSLRMMTGSLNFNKETVLTILHEDLG